MFTKLITTVMNYYKTNRSFTNVETNEVCDLWMDSEKHEYKLIHTGSETTSKGSKVNGFYISAHSSVTIKVNSRKQVYLPMGCFYNLKGGEEITHKKYCGFNKFTKIK